MHRRLIITAIVTAIGCSSATDNGGTSITLQVSPDSVALLRGQTIGLSVNAVDTAGHLVTGIAVTFRSGNPSIASVTNLGVVTAVQKGKTSITVSGGGASAVVPVTVSVPLAGVRLTPASAAIHQHDSVQYSAALVDIDGDPVSPQPAFTFSSQDTTLVTINARGLAHSVGPAGGTLIVARDSVGRSMSAEIQVIDSTILARLYIAGSPQFVGVFGNTAYIARPFNNQVAVVNLLTTAVIDSIAVGALPCGIVFNRSGTRAYVANQFSDNVSIINPSTRTEIGTIPLHGDPLPVAVPAGDSVLFVTTNANMLFKINTRNNTVVDSLALPATSHHLFVHPNDTLLYVATRDAGSVLEVNWRTMTLVRTFPLGVQTLGMEMSPDRSELYVTTASVDSLYTITLASGATSSAPVEAGASTIALNAAGTQLYVGLLFAGKVEVLDRGTRAHVKTVVTGGTVRDMATDGPRNRVIVTNEGGWVDFIR
jgi:YVTN family beta-propeller protein